MPQIRELSLEEELEKNPKLKVSDIDHLREWCTSQTHLPGISCTDLILFLHSNYYNMEATKKTIDAFYTQKTQFTELFADRDPLGDKKFRQIFHVASAIPLKQLTKEGYHIILARLVDNNPANFHFNNVTKLYLMALELWLHNAGTIDGHVLIFDVHNVCMGHIARLNLTGAKRFLTFLQCSLPVRLKAMHFLHVNQAMNIILRMLRPFMKKELTDMLFMHTSLESLKKYIPVESLPNEVGGQAGPILELHETEIKKIEAYRDWFLDDQLIARVDESKRPTTDKSTAKSSKPTEQNFNKFDID